MDLALDAGNSGLKGAFFEGDRLVHSFRTGYAQDGADGWLATLRPHVGGRRVERVGIASVVPAVTAALRDVLPALSGPAPFVVHHALRLPFRLAYRTPETLGTDRLAAAAAAVAGYGRAPDGTARAVVALDAGTAVTLEVIDAGGVYRGGVIAAGPDLVRDALAGGTAQLPPVPLDLPPSVIGGTTREALQAGILFTFLEGVRGLLARTEAALGTPPVVVATGGWGPFLAEHLEEVSAVDPHLVLRGVHVLMRLNPDA